MAPPTDESTVPADNTALTQDDIDAQAEELNKLRETIAAAKAMRQAGHEQGALQQTAAAMAEEKQRLQAELQAELRLIETEQEPTSNVVSARELMLKVAAEQEAENAAAQAKADAAVAEQTKTETEVPATPAVATPAPVGKPTATNKRPVPAEASAPAETPAGEGK